MWLSKLLQLSPRSAANMVGKVALYFQNHLKNWSKFMRVLSLKSTSGSFDETMLFTVVVSASTRSSLILLVVELIEKQRRCDSSLSRKQFDAGEKARKDLMRDIKLRKPVAELAPNSINDLKVRCFQIQTLTSTVNSDVFCYDVLSESTRN